MFSGSLPCYYTPPAGEPLDPPALELQLRGVDAGLGLHWAETSCWSIAFMSCILSSTFDTLLSTLTSDVAEVTEEFSSEVVRFSGLFDAAVPKVDTDWSSITGTKGTGPSVDKGGEAVVAGGACLS